MAKEDTEVAIRARIDGKFSNNIKLTIYWEVNGYLLPPEPDPKVNNATLEGVDSNNNGVRDDVERKIYEKYHDKLQIALMMDTARVYQKIIVKPVDGAKITQKGISRAIDCRLFLKRKSDAVKKNGIKYFKFIRENTINTKQRVRKYLDYNLALSGGVYGSSPSDWNKDACSQEVKNVLKEMGL